jgi:flagellar basal-body rod modification protein FlgD
MSTTPIALSSQTSSASQTAAASAAASTSDLANQNVFLQLLVAQLKYQDPENPADGTTFITQLAQFSELSNSTQMVSDLGAIQTDLTPTAAAAAQAAAAAVTGTPPAAGADTTGSNTNANGNPAIVNS